MHLPLRKEQRDILVTFPFDEIAGTDPEDAKLRASCVVTAADA